MLKYLSLFTCIYFILATKSNTYAVSESALQEVRYTKALVAFNNNEFNKALIFLQRNLNPSLPHKNSFELIAQIHEKRQHYQKAIRVYYHLLKLQKANVFIHLKNDENLKINLNQIPKPTGQELSYLFKIANLYLSWYDLQSEEFKQLNSKKKPVQKSVSQRIIQEKTITVTHITDEEKQEVYLNKILLRTEKYLAICEHYDFSLALVHFLQASLEKRKNNHYEANRLFKLAHSKTINSEKNDPEFSDLREVLEFYIGDSLLKTGHKELATRYFSNLAATVQNPSLQNYSKFYVDSLTNNYLSFFAGLGAGTDTNPYNQDARLISNPQFGQSDYFTTKEVGIFYNSNQFNDWGYTVNLSYQDQQYTNQIYRKADLQTIGLNSELKFIKLPKSIMKLGFSYYRFDTKNDNSTQFTSFANNLSINPIYDRYLDGGILSFSLPITQRNFSTEFSGAQSLETLMAIAYTPWTKSIWLSPSYSLAAGQTSTNGVFSNSTNLRASVSNQMSPKEGHSILTSFNLAQDAAQIKNESATSIDINAQWLMDLSFWVTGLTHQLKIEASQVRTGEETNNSLIRRYRLSTQLQLTF
jgi:hypothetical protein